MAGRAISYVQTEKWANAPQLLQVAEEGGNYAPHVVHATLEEVRPRISRRRRGHVHDVYHIVLYTQGEGDFLLDNRLHPFKEGSLVLSGPGDVHDYGAINCRAAYTEVSFEFRHTETGEALPLPFPVLLERLTGTAVQDFSFPFDLEYNAAAKVSNLIAEIVGNLRSRSGFGPFRTCVSLAQLLRLCADLCLSPASEGSPTSLSPLDAARDYIQNNYTTAITVDELAEKAGQSRGHFLREFRSRYGTSPIAYQIRLRMEAAKVLLKTTNLRCHEIAARVGYDDAFHFSRSFKQAVGVPPTVFRTGQRKA